MLDDRLPECKKLQLSAERVTRRHAVYVRLVVYRKCMAQDRSRFYVYVDEAGDRGWGRAASPVFVLSAVIVKAVQDTALRAALNSINVGLERPPTRELHWAENLRPHATRKHVARQIASLPLVLANVVVCKDSLVKSGTALDDPARTYHYAVRRLLERVSWAVDRKDGCADLRFAHVRRFKYDPLFKYLEYLRADPECRIAWAALKNGTRPKIEQPSQIRGLQVADAVAGAVYAAVRPDQHGDVEPGYLRAIAPRLWRGPSNNLHKYGLHFIQGRQHDCRAHHSWFAELQRTSGLRY